ncbi:MAG TPA: Asp-tRNA(Asn)/Glu-tRNA(Gln) amidotransferase subunit GatA [Clostridiales bacterium]|nr:Asp-tRNA(Asn)/Glu-tRNA(Gln) amidotransferase subunit GatA [Clostridiales bacterium]
MNDILKMSATDISRLIKDRKIKVEELIQIQFKRIKQVEPNINSFISTNEEKAMIKAREVQELIDQGQLRNSNIVGIPIAIKDNICTKGIITSAASKTLSNYKPIYDATVINKLNDAGAIIIGKTNLDEFAMGGSTTTSYYGASRNPVNNDYITGGSSGGSAAAIAADQTFLSLATDTGGSIRQPASYCGVVGLKPSYGRVSRYGMIPFASSLDQIGTITKNVSDTVALFDAIYGNDGKDSNMITNQTFSMNKALASDIKGLRIGIPIEFMDEGLDQEIRDKVNDSVEVLQERGAIVEEFHLDILNYIKPVYYIIACAESSSNMGKFDGIRYGKDLANGEDLGLEVKLRTLFGIYVLTKDNYYQIYEQALKVRRLIKNNIDNAFTKYDVLIGPTVPNIVPNFREFEKDPYNINTSTKYTAAANLAGIPAISIPCGIDRRGLPIGLQIMGKSFCEEDVLRVAYTYEQAIKKNR